MESFIPKPHLFSKKGLKLSSCGSSDGTPAKHVIGASYSDPPAKECMKQWCDVSCMTSVAGVCNTNSIQ